MARTGIIAWIRKLTGRLADPHARTDVLPANAASLPPRDEPCPSPAASARPILVVDDQRTNQTLLMMQLKAIGHEAEAAGTVAQALDKWHSRRYGAVITDCNMADLNGYDLARTIRRVEQEEKRPRTPIIGWSANAQEDGEDACLAAGMDAYLQKTADSDLLAELLARWIPSQEQRMAGAARKHQAQAPLTILDRSVLERYSEGDSALERQILREYRSANIIELEAVRHALTEQDTDLLGETCHRLKGASRIIGAHAFAAVCERMEHHARTGDWAAIEAGMNGFFAESQRLEDALETE